MVTTMVTTVVTTAVRQPSRGPSGATVEHEVTHVQRGDSRATKAHQRAGDPFGPRQALH